MICSNCGKEIEAGASYCLECGASIDEPVVISAEQAKDATILKEVVINDGPFIDFSGYVKALGNDTSVLVGFLATVLVYLAPFFSWIWKEQFGEKVTGNLFELGGKNSEMSINSGVLILLATLIVLSAIDMLAFSGCKYIGPLKRFEKNYIVRGLPIITTTVFFVLAINVEKYKASLSYIKEQVEIAKKLGEGFSFSGGMGVGVFMLIIGIILYGVSVLLSYMKNKQ